MPPSDASRAPRRRSRGSCVEGRRRSQSASELGHDPQLVAHPAGGVRARRRRRTRPSRLVMVPSSSAHWVTGRTTSARPRSRRGRSRRPPGGRAARAPHDGPRSATTTTRLEPCTQSARTPPGCPSDCRQLDGGHAGTGDGVGLDAPHARHVGAGVGVGDLAVAGKLVALLPVLAAALAVALTGERAVAAARRGRAGRAAGRG